MCPVSKTTAGTWMRFVRISCPPCPPPSQMPDAFPRFFDKLLLCSYIVEQTTRFPSANCRNSICDAALNVFSDFCPILTDTTLCSFAVRSSTYRKSLQPLSRDGSTPRRWALVLLCIYLGTLHKGILIVMDQE